jgi:O-antigen/teichoic acid export membrane protein
VAATILRNTLAITIGEWIVRALNLIFTIYMVRVLGETGLGNYSTVLAFASLFAVCFELGTSQYAQRAIAREPSQAKTLLWNIVLIRLSLGAVGIIALPLVAHLIGYPRELVVGVFLHATTFLLVALLSPLTSVLEGNERFDLTVLFQLVNQITWLVVAFTLMRLNQTFLALIWSGVLALPLQILLSALAVHRLRLAPLGFYVDAGRWRAIVAGSLPFALSSLTLGVGFNSDTVVLAQCYDQRVVGWYNAAYRLVFAINSAASGFYRAVTPSLVREQSRDPLEVNRWVVGSLRVLLSAALPAAAFVCVVAPEVVRLLYGPAFDASASVLRVIVWDVPFVVFNAFVGNISTVLGLERRAARLYVWSAVASVVLNSTLIPFWGVLAAAYVTVLTDMIKAVGLALTVQAHLPLGAVARAATAALFATLLMAVAAALARPFGLVTATGVAAIVYVAAAARFRVVDRDLAFAIWQRMRQAGGTVASRP